MVDLQTSQLHHLRSGAPQLIDPSTDLRSIITHHPTNSTINMSNKEQPTSADGEVCRPAWQGSRAWISYGLSFPDACAKHISSTFKASRAYILASGSLSRNTDQVRRLQEKLGQSVVGTRYGMRPHTLWSEILEVTKEAKELKADLLITLGAGSLTDAAKIIALVSTVTVYRTALHPC